MLPLLLSVLLSLTASAQEAIPAELQPWVPWVLDRHPALRCPILNEQAACIWPGVLTLDIDDDGGQLTLEVQVDRDIAVPLPGGEGAWPQQVRVDGDIVPIQDGGGVPSVALSAGRHRIAATFVWSRPPQELPVPASIGLIDLTLRGASVPARPRDGRLQLTAGSGEAEEDSRLEIDVSRRIHDGVPVRVTTEIALRVSGSPQETDLGAILPDNLRPVSLTADLPARLSEAGTLTLQARPGSFTITLEALHDGPLTTLTAPSPGGDWPSQEFWAVQVDDQVRAVDLSGPPAVDPARTSLPEAWHSLPTFIVAPGSELTFTELRRGEPEPAPNQLTLNRELWLDADGSGLTVRDTWAGQMRQGWRLDLLEPAQLGHVSDHGEEQVITAAPLSGVELRWAEVSLIAESRIEGRPGKLPAVGWDTDVNRLSGTLHLPPGWRLLDATGVDNIPDSLLARWSLLDIFFVLVLSMATWKLLGWKWGLAALIGLTISRHEPLAPSWAWVILLSVFALERALPSGRLSVAALWSRRIVAIGVALMVVEFANHQLRTGLFPILEEPWSEADDTMYSDMTVQTNTVEMLPSQDRQGSQGSRDDWSGRRGEDTPTDGIYGGKNRSSKKGDFLTYQQDPTAVVQTGPGLPRWSWTSRSLQWSGPVTEDHQMRLLLIGPTANTSLALLRVALLLLLVLRLLGMKRFRLPPRRVIAPLALLLIALPARADPNAALLAELERRLTAAPSCAPDCLSVPLAAISVEDDTLTIEAEVHAVAATAWPIPGPAATWSPDRVRVDDRAAVAMRRESDGFLMLRLDPGVHHIRISGPLTGRDALALQLGQLPQHTDFTAEGWGITGLHGDGTVEPLLHLTRTLETASQPGTVRSQENLSPWLEVHRTLDLGIPWRVRTVVRRPGAVEAPISVSVPLLPGEAVTTEGIQIDRGAAAITLDVGESERTWVSNLEEQDTLTLSAPENVPWTEQWTLSCSPVFRCSTSGLAPLHHTHDGHYAPVWRPWPGETVQLDISRPAAAAGQTVTIDQVRLQVTPGSRLSESSLILSIRSSQGGQQLLTLPDAADLQEVFIDGVSRPVQARGSVVPIPLTPGIQLVEVTWRMPHSPGLVEWAPQIDLGGPAANVTLTITPPPDRWILGLLGPSWGPVAWYWSTILLILIVAPLLSRLPYAPLTTPQWVLLGLGMTQVPLLCTAIVVLWFVAVGWRRAAPRTSWWQFDLVQLALVGLTGVALICLYAAIHTGLLYPPDMQIQGNGSSSSQLHWFADRTDSALPRPAIISLPLWSWRVVMLAWALWLAGRMVRWLPWTARSMGIGGLYRLPPQPPTPGEE
ncbi:MAG: hypothetical protein ACI8RZ_003499 [Myxococcota bacterium]|jgi:hypothetical protein